VQLAVEEAHFMDESSSCAVDHLLEADPTVTEATAVSESYDRLGEAAYTFVASALGCSGTAANLIAFAYVLMDNFESHSQFTVASELARLALGQVPPLRLTVPGRRPQAIRHHVGRDPGPGLIRPFDRDAGRSSGCLKPS
jgi:hypothetical protein